MRVKSHQLPMTIRRATDPRMESLPVVVQMETEVLAAVGKHHIWIQIITTVIIDLSGLFFFLIPNIYSISHF